MLEALTPAADRARLETHVADLADFEIPACDLVNASLILPFLPAATTRRPGVASRSPWAPVAASAACSSGTVTRLPANPR